MAVSIARIGIDIQNLADQIEQDLESALQEFLFSFGERLVINTPVDTGKLRGSWNLSMKQPVAVSEPKLERGTEGSADPETLARFESSLGQFRLGDIAYFSNSAPYVLRLEFGFTGIDSLGRNYDQGPRPFIRNTANQAPVIFNETLSRVL